jgi:predicted RNA-binding Zn ribbon-like protein
MPFTSKEKQTSHPGFVFVGDHPAVDFANTLVMVEGQLTDLLRDWKDVVDWCRHAGLSKDPHLQIPASRNQEAVKSVADLRQDWRSELDRLMAGGKVREDFVKQLLAGDFFHETLRRNGKSGFHLDRSASQLTGAKLVLALMARQMAHFLAESNPEYLHRCANVTSCVLYFYDTTKNHRRQWCSVATCGNRHKVAEFRKRQVKPSQT